MFDPTKPNNKLEKLPPKINFKDVEILERLVLASKNLSKLEGAALSIPSRDLLIKTLSVREAVASSGIENINTTVAEVFQASVFPDRNVSKEQKETIHYVEALNVGYEILQKKGFLNTNGILDIQKVLEPNKSGIRKLPGTKIQNTLTGEILYTPPEGESVIRSLLKNFEDYFNTDDQIDPLLKTAVLHYQFEAIHPFYDGNGRTGRMLMVLYLTRTKQLELPILYISGFINSHRPEYYQLLNKVTSEGDWKSWVMYILRAIEVQSKETENTVLAIKLLMEKYRELIKKKLPTIYSIELVEYLFSSPYYSQTSMSKYFEIERLASSLRLKKLVDAKLIKVKKVGRDNIYYNEKLLEVLK